MGAEDFKPDQNIEDLDAEALNKLAKQAHSVYVAAANEYTRYRLYDKENPPEESEKQARQDNLASLKRAEDLACLEWNRTELLSEEKKR